MLRWSLLPPSAGYRTDQLNNATRYYTVAERGITELFIRVQRRWGGVADPEIQKRPLFPYAV